LTVDVCECDMIDFVLFCVSDDVSVFDVHVHVEEEKGRVSCNGGKRPTLAKMGQT